MTEPIGPGRRPSRDPDPGRKLRIGGGVLMGLGAGGVLGGGVFGLGFGLARKSAEVDLDGAQGRFDALGCEAGDPGVECDKLAGDIESAKDKEQLRGGLAIGLGVSLSAAGVIVLTAGALIFRHGKNKTKTWAAEHALIVAPAPGGMALSFRY